MIPSELINADKNGNAVIGKNLEIDGTTKLNGGLKPLTEYRFASGKLMNYGTFEGNENILILGLQDDEGNYNCIGLGDFTLDNQKISSFAITGFDFNNDDILRFTLTNEGTIDAEFFARAIDTQATLYRHKITLNGIYVLMYNSTSDLSVNSVTDLRTIMKITSESNEEILPVCASDATAMVTLVVTNSLCQVDGSDVTTVSDTVTAL